MMKGYVSHWMAKALVNVRPGDPLFEALEVMASQGVRHVLVVDAEEHLLGIVSNRDIIRSAMRSPEKRLEFFACKVGDVMTAMPLVTTRSHTSLGEAAALMHKHKVSALPVTDGAQLCGLLTTDDVLAAVSRPESVANRPDA